MNIKLKIENKVCFLGQCGNVNDLYQAMDCFFMPSVYEGLPVAGIEAQAMGLPCVFSDNITKELAYTDLAIFIPFSKGIDEWGRILLNIKNNKRIDREVYHDKLKSSDFSDTGCGQRLLEYYKNRIQKVSC